LRIDWWRWRKTGNLENGKAIEMGTRERERGIMNGAQIVGKLWHHGAK
jgi:hypothetical protein